MKMFTKRISQRTSINVDGKIYIHYYTKKAKIIFKVGISGGEEKLLLLLDLAK